MKALKTKGLQMDYLALQGVDARSYSQSRLQMNLQNIENSIKKKWEIFVESWLNLTPDTSSKRLVINNEDYAHMALTKEEPEGNMLRAIQEVLRPHP